MCTGKVCVRAYLHAINMPVSRIQDSRIQDTRIQGNLDPETSGLEALA